MTKDKDKIKKYLNIARGQLDGIMKIAIVLMYQTNYPQQDHYLKKLII